MSDRWLMHECAPCETLWPLGISLCQYCARRIDAHTPVSVVRAQPARHTDPDTSRRAALTKAPAMTSQRGRILEYMRTTGPATSREIEEALAIGGAWKRVSELKQGGHIVEIGTRWDPKTGTLVSLYDVSTGRPNGSLF